MLITQVRIPETWNVQRRQNRHFQAGNKQLLIDDRIRLVITQADADQILKLAEFPPGLTIVIMPATRGILSGAKLSGSGKIMGVYITDQDTLVNVLDKIKKYLATEQVKEKFPKATPPELPGPAETSLPPDLSARILRLQEQSDRHIRITPGSLSIVELWGKKTTVQSKDLSGRLDELEMIARIYASRKTRSAADKATIENTLQKINNLLLDLADQKQTLFMLSRDVERQTVVLEMAEGGRTEVDLPSCWLEIKIAAFLGDIPQLILQEIDGLFGQLIILPQLR